MPKPLLVFVHGWSVTSTGTYGGLPARLKAEAAREGGPGIDVAHVHLGQYVSFRNEVRIDDIARAFEAALGPVLVLAGAIQFVAGAARLGGMFRAISPAVVHGMLAGIGALIVIGQFHILFDAKPQSNGTENLVMMPARLLGLSPFSWRATEFALLLGLITIGTMVGWDKFKPARFKLVPGALLGVIAATVVAMIGGLDVARIAVPERWPSLTSRLPRKVGLRSDRRCCSGTSATMPPPL